MFGGQVVAQALAAGIKAGGPAKAFGRIFRRDGRLVASVAQEGLVKRFEPSSRAASYEAPRRPSAFQPLKAHASAPSKVNLTELAWPPAAFRAETRR